MQASRHSGVLNKRELKRLMSKAEDFELNETDGEKLPVDYAYRNKSDDYFEDIEKNRSNIMEVYIKDNNGDPRCPINGNIDGLFFAVRPEPDTMEIPTVSPFGRRRIILPIDKLIKSNRRLYFADFWCHNKIHYVTLVVTKPSTDADIFCREHLPKLSLESNPFLYREISEFYCCEEPRVEIFYTENIDLNKSYIQWDSVRTIGRGSSTPGGKPKRRDCSICNLYPYH